MRLFKLPPPSYFLTLVLFLFASLLFTGCKKTGDVFKKELPENISKQELLLWINNYQKLMPDGHADLLNSNSTCANNCHFADAPISRLDVWILN